MATTFSIACVHMEVQTNKRLTDLLSVKKQLPCSQLLCWIRCRLLFALLRSSIMAVRGSQSLKPTSYSNDILIAYTEAAVCDHV